MLEKNHLGQTILRMPGGASLGVFVTPELAEGTRGFLSKVTGLGVNGLPAPESHLPALSKAPGGEIWRRKDGRA